jgi:hypothetical protein
MDAKIGSTQLKASEAGGYGYGFRALRFFTARELPQQNRLVSGLDLVVHKIGRSSSSFPHLLRSAAPEVRS